MVSSGNVLFNLLAYIAQQYNTTVIVQKVTPPSRQMGNGRCRTCCNAHFFQLHDFNTRPRWLQTASTNVPAASLFTTFHSPIVISHFCAKHPQHHKDNSSTIESNIRVLTLNANGNEGLV